MKGSGIPYASRLATTSGVNPSLAGMARNLRDAAHKPLLSAGRLKVLWTETSLWLGINVAPDVKALVRLCAEQHPLAKVEARRRGPAEINLRVSGGLGRYRVKVSRDDDEWLRLRITMTLKTTGATFLGSLSRDVYLVNSRYEPLDEGMIFTKHTGPTSEHAFVSAGPVSVFYCQNIPALASVARLGGAALADSVDVEWPELGFRMPALANPLPPACEVVLSDAFLRIDPKIYETEAERALLFIDHLAAVYRQIEVPRTKWFDWAAMAARTVRDVERCEDCQRRHKGVTYVNAYVGSFYKPPESMVQGAVRVPLAEYEEWLGKPVKLVRMLNDSQKQFFDRKSGILHRWLPGCDFEKEQPSEEEAHGRVDSWYLLHSLMNIGRLAELGHESERTIFINALKYVIRVARHFDHDWPVFFDQKSLRVYKKETKDGHGGEQDAPGLYVHVMMQAWRVTRDPLYLAEAESAAEKLKGLGFSILYQTNNTMFSAVALAWLWKETGNALYKELGFICIGSILSHLWMWEMGDPERPWHTFMGLPPLHDAPYIAAYEEAEVAAAAEAYLKAMDGELPEAIVLLLSEYWKHLLHRAKWYFPSELPDDALCPEPREGFTRRSLAIPVEDLYPTAEKAGQVGQEVYGAALALILVTRSHHRWKDLPFDVWADAQVLQAEFRNTDKGREGCLELRLAGTPHQNSLIRILPRKPGNKSIRVTVKAARPGEKFHRRTRVANPEGHRMFRIPGGMEVRIQWRKQQPPAK